MIRSIEEEKFTPLLENAYLNLARAYGEIGDFAKAQGYLKKNLDLRERSGNEKRLAVGLTLAAITAAFHKREIAMEYLDRRKETWIPLELHWKMISDALRENGYPEFSENRKWK